LPLSTEVAMRPATKFVEATDPSVRIEKQALVAAVAAKTVAVLDVREPDEFAGARKYGESRGGHIPGAVNVPRKSFFTESGTLLPKAGVERLLSERGVPPGKPIVVYCTGGVRSGFAFVALKSAGLKAVANYDGSFWEWAADAALPVDTN
jgi:thiosulfate/3-mercaptopyruvate sulfurtransferase